MTRRKPLPKKIEAAVLLNSGRRCCLCYGLSADFRQKKGQLAHLDHNRANHSESNLVFLCLFHHDEYDSPTSQSKGFTEAELKFYRNMLYGDIRHKLPREQHPLVQKKDSAERVIQAALGQKDQPFISGYLLNGHQIHQLVRNGIIRISPFDPMHTDFTAHQMTLGREALIEGALSVASGKQAFLVPAGASAVVRTAEMIALPTQGIVARLSARSALLRYGFVAETAATIQPGFAGHLAMLLTNTTKAPVPIAPGMTIAAVEFSLFQMPPNEWLQRMHARQGQQGS